MNKFLAWFTRDRQEMLYALFILIGCIGCMLNSMEITHHPVHLELDHCRIHDSHEELIEHHAGGPVQPEEIDIPEPEIIDAFREQDEILLELLESRNYLKNTGIVVV